MKFRPTQLIWLALFSFFTCSEANFCSAVANSVFANSVFARDDNPRLTPLVQAVQQCRKSVVNLRGRKSVPDSSESKEVSKIKQVNGMGTGIVIDSRGYVLTNYHVVQGVKEIEVTTFDNVKTTAVLLAHDSETDLAILKVNLGTPLPKIKIGTSSDLMLAESVTAIGNAYGYEHTVTTGIISQLGRTVQLNDQQVYRNLIQIDASINPGNSGGPLLNMNGELIGINVAVRMGAQGIAFAIPINDAMEVAARLMSQLVPAEIHHGVVARTVYVGHQPHLIVQDIESGSPASKAGLFVGDRIIEINGNPVFFEADFQSSFFSSKSSDQVKMLVLQNEKEVVVSMDLQTKSRVIADKSWELLGVRVTPISKAEMGDRHPDYKAGLKITQVRGGSPAALGGLTSGDVIVAMHDYRIESMDNLTYVLTHPQLTQKEKLIFFILRDQVPYKGEMRMAKLEK